MLEFDGQVFGFSDQDTKTANLFGQGEQTYSTDGIRIGGVSWDDGRLEVDTLWNINLIKDLSPTAKSSYAAMLSLISPDGTPTRLDNESIANNSFRPDRSFKIPDRISYDLDADLLEQLSNGSRLVLGISQKYFISRPGTDDNFAYSTSADLTDAITGNLEAGTTSLQRDPITNATLPLRPKSGSDRRLIGVEQFLDGCDFSNQDLSGLNLGQTNDGKNVRVSRVSFKNSNLRQTIWGHYSDENSYSYSQWWSNSGDISPRVDLSYSDLTGARMWLNSNRNKVNSPEWLNSVYTSKIPPANYPNIAHAAVYDLFLSVSAPQSPTFLRIRNESNKSVNVNDITTWIWNPWSTGLAPGQEIQITGTTAWMSGDDISLGIPGIGKVIANNPPLASTYVDINGQRFTDDSHTLTIDGRTLRVSWRGDVTDPRWPETIQKEWELTFL